jgi:hypothetical protein
MKRINIISAYKTTLLSILGCLISFIFLGIELAIFGENSSNLCMMNPLISGFLHNGISHFTLNILLLFLMLIPDINVNYGIKKIIVLSMIISIIYLPISLLNITRPAIGLSGTIYFLIVRWLLNWEKKKAGIAFLGIFILGEILCMKDADNVAHGVHLIGVALGFLSMQQDIFKKYIPILMPDNNFPLFINKY